jgi:predicted N-acetyltransferase YhbS
MLVSVLHGPSQAEFQSQLDDPFYEPQDRLFVRHATHVIAHAHLTRREMHFGPEQFAVAGLADLAVLPEYRGHGCGSALLNAVEQRMTDDGAVLGVLRTSTPEFFQRRGWCVCTRHSYSLAGARKILSHLRATENVSRSPLRQPASPLNIRLWRHVERAALCRLYAENTAKAYGPLVRSEPYWQWLIGREAYDRIYVAIDGPDKLALDDHLTPIVGYAVMREGRILELMTTPEHPKVASQLLARACSDAIEHDLHDVRIDAAPHCPIHQVLVEAGGEQHYHEAENGEVFLVKLFAPDAFLRRLRPQLLRRAKQARLELPCELGLNVDGAKCCLSVRRRGVGIKRGRLGRSYLECGHAEFVQLLLGHLNVHAAVAAGRLGASTRIAQQIAGVLFPGLPLWRPPLDYLRA